MTMTTSYDLVSVNWNPPQTKLWLHHVRKTCPKANVVLLPDYKPIPWNWSSGKIACFSDRPEYKHPGRFVYMDTDTIVTRDVGEVFEMMGGEGDAQIAASCAIPSFAALGHILKGVPLLVAFGLPTNQPPKHYSSGFMVLKDTDPAELGHKWLAAMEYPVLKAAQRKHKLYEELALTYVLAAERYKMWDMPLEIHGNILRRLVFGHTHEPMCIHYHQPGRLVRNKLEKYLDTTAP